MRDRLVSGAGVAIIVALIVATVEVAAFFSTTYLARRYGILFYLPQITEDYAKYSARVNPLLGWPSPQALAKDRDNPGDAPISAYGDSFTAGYGVEPEYAWSNVLGHRLGLRIANFGVPGYGTDQAYLRFRDNTRDKAKIVLLGVLSENIQRNVNQLRNFLIPSSQCQTKPRLILDEGGHLQFVPLPQLTPENYDDFIRNPELFLKNDFFVPGGPSGAQKLEFPYTWSILKAYKFFYNRYFLGYKSYLQFYLPNHPSQAFPLTTAIINKFISEAKDRGKHPIVVVFPTDEDFRVYNKKEKKFIYEPLIHEFNRKNIAHIDLGSELLQRLGDRNYLEIFLGGKYHHFNEEGNRLTAQILYDFFKANDVIASQGSASESNDQPTGEVGRGVLRKGSSSGDGQGPGRRG